MRNERMHQRIIMSGAGRRQRSAHASESRLAMILQWRRNLRRVLSVLSTVVWIAANRGREAANAVRSMPVGSTYEDDAIQARLREIIAHGRSGQRALIAMLSDAERAAIGEPNHWSAKDHLAHLNFWRRRALEHMAAAERDEEVPAYTGDDEVQRINAQTFAERRSMPWDAIVAESERLFSAAAGQIDRLTPSQLTGGRLSPGREGRPLVEDVLGAFFLHPADHYAQLYREHGDTERADRQRVATAEAMGEIFGQSSPLYGTELYNLGCYWALTERPERAVEAVRRAFALNPTLVAWSRHDSDLDSLRDLPVFQALFVH